MPEGEALPGGQVGPPRTEGLALQHPRGLTLAPYASLGVTPRALPRAFLVRAPHGHQGEGRSSHGHKATRWRLGMAPLAAPFYQTPTALWEKPLHGPALCREYQAVMVLPWW